MSDDNNENENPPVGAGGSEAGDRPDDAASRGEEGLPDLDIDALIGSGNESGGRSGRDTGRGSKPEWLEEEVSDDAVEENAILVPKHRRGVVGSRDY